MDTQGSYELHRERAALGGDEGEERTTSLTFADGTVTASYTLFRNGSFDLTGIGFSGEDAPQAADPDAFSERTRQDWRQQIQKELDQEAEHAAWAAADLREAA